MEKEKEKDDQANPHNLFAEYRRELLVRDLSNTEKYDGAILSLSTALLGLSMAFLKHVAPSILHIWNLTWSWYLFAAAIGSTLVSFLISGKAVEIQLGYAEKYYLYGDEAYLNKKNWYASITKYINLISGLTFIAAIILSVIFVTTNLNGDLAMKDKKSVRAHAQDAATIPKMVSTNGKQDIISKGAKIPPMPAVRPAGSKKGGAVSANQTTNPSKENQSTNSRDKK